MQLVRTLGLGLGLARACVLALGVSALGIIPAGAQEGEAAAAAPPPPAPTFEACAAPQCLRVSLAPDLAGALAAGERVSVERLGQGLAFELKGEPLDARLIAARYDNNRLVRYAVSARTPLGGEAGLVVSDAGATVERAFRPVTTSAVEVASYGEDAVVPLQIQSFVGNVPPSYLVGEPGKSLIPAGGPHADEAMTGSVGILVLEPELAALRDGAAAHSYAALVRLDLKRP